MHALRANWYLSTSALSTSQESGTVPPSGQKADENDDVVSKKPIEEAPRYKTHFPLIPIMGLLCSLLCSQGKYFAEAGSTGDV